MPVATMLFIAQFYRIDYTVLNCHISVDLIFDLVFLFFTNNGMNF